MFENCPAIDFAILANQESFRTALSNLEKQIKDNALYSCPIVNGTECPGEESIASIDPSSTTTLGMVRLATIDETEAALESLSQGAAAWAHTDYTQRAEIIRRAGDLMIERRLQLTALIVREAGKPWIEADADVIEAVDFCHYYADEMLRLGQVLRLGDRLGEVNHYFYRPRGIGVVIAPWNFPLAIACGMTVASLVTGNATVLKPAEQTSLIAFELAKILLEAGVPHGAFAYLPGHGELIGARLVDDPRVALICFTGSKAVGLEIVRRAAIVHPGQRNVKKVIAEMGGKNAIIVDEDADLDDAVRGVIYSAFGFSGQKCSACSRVLAVGSVYDVFIERLCEATSNVIIGTASDPATLIGPVIDEEAQSRIGKIMQRADQQCNLAFRGEAPNHSGYFIPPTIYKDVAPEVELWREEIFGPVLACAPVANFELAIELAMDSPYALTGGVFSRSPVNIEFSRRNFNVGNLYINRSCTGAIVYRQPFGGAAMSGIGSKAGGPDYLIQFLQPHTVTENTMRKGFSPDLI